MNKNTQSTTKSRKNEEQRREVRKQLWMRLAAVFILIAFLAAECSTLILMD
ncbi:MAG: hypothetical protein QM730_18125 [Anaerolineales bacterium]